MDINNLTIKEASAGLQARAFSSVELTQEYLKRIENRNKEINAYISVTSELALAEAEQADKIISAGDSHTLTGIPFGVKDAICVDSVRSTGAGKILDNYIPGFDATVIRKIRSKGAVLLGKQNCDAFGHGASNENSMYGLVKNPVDQTKVSGGSSGGSAAALADNQCLFSIAEDTGGSIRQPASFCGVVGLRPSYGRNSRYGIMPMASSLDTVGPMAKTVEDIAILMNVMAGQDKKDATTVPDSVPDYTKDLGKSVKNLTVGVPKEYFEVEGIDPKVEVAVRLQIEKLKDLGCKIVDVSLPFTKYAIPTYYIVVPCEDSSNLARLDGIRYGVRKSSDNLYDVYADSRQAGFPEEVKRRIMIGTYALSAGYYDAYYKKAQKVRTLIRRDFTEVFNQVDLLITPTAPTTAFGLGEKSGDVLSMYLADIFVAPSALAGLPGLSLPANVVDSSMPIGIQIIGARMQEAKVLNLGYQLHNN